MIQADEYSTSTIALNIQGLFVRSRGALQKKKESVLYFFYFSFGIGQQQYNLVQIIFNNFKIVSGILSLN